MDESMLLNGVLRAVFGGRGRRRHSRRALNYLTGGGADRSGRTRRRCSTAAGMAWGIYETMQQSQGSGGSMGRRVQQVRGFVWFTGPAAAAR